MMTKNYCLYYWTACKDFWGRAIGVVLTLEDAKRKGCDINYVIKVPDEAPKDIGFAVPMIQLPTGQVVAQTPAILNVLGTTFGLCGQTVEQQIACQQCVLDVDDIFSEVIQKKWEGKKERADKWFALLESKLTKSKFLVCDEPTVADFHGVFAFEWVLVKYEGDFKAFPKLTQWWTAINDYPPVKDMRASGIKMIPT
uniref:GST C-terminal domain-containing protein n=2 Tax=Aureoumbra lagunensis TaxID=44058 RepID=A0A7S3JYJ1_9STRA|mmetsp:Transcript_5834/g.8286  ORF Transcript_5834/g.8286 Transcript_5834/m.8286 type:complete len:197 (-) Transcript_5834:2983-3573(-)